MSPTGMATTGVVGSWMGGWWGGGGGGGDFVFFSSEKPFTV